MRTPRGSDLNGLKKKSSHELDKNANEWQSCVEINSEMKENKSHPCLMFITPLCMGFSSVRCSVTSSAVQLHPMSVCFYALG